MSTVREPTARQAMAEATSEADFQAAVIRYAHLHGWRVQHHWSEQHSRAGWPDLTLWRPRRFGDIDGRFLVAELKSEHGRLSAAQRATIEELRDCGIDVRVWGPSDWEEVEKCLA